MENQPTTGGPYYGTPPPTTPGSTDDGKTAAIVAYITLIGWLISYFALYKENKTQLAAFHLRQTLMLFLIGIGWAIVQSILLASVPGLYFVSPIVNIGLFVLWLLGLIAAINGQAKPMPVIGAPAQKTFAGI